MTIHAIQNASSKVAILGPIQKIVDGAVVAATGLTIANTDVTLVKPDATALATKHSGGGTELSAGYYSFTFDTDDLDVLGTTRVVVAPADVLSFPADLMVMTEANYNAAIAGTAAAEVALSTDALTDVATAVDVAGALATYDGPTKAELDAAVAPLATAAALATVDGVADAVKAVTDKVDSMLEADGGNSRYTEAALALAPSGGGTGGGDATEAKQDQILGILGAPAGASLSADVAAGSATGAAIKAKTDGLPASPAATGDIPTASTVAGAVRTELATELAHLDADVSTRATPDQANAAADQALADYDAPTKAELDAVVAPLATSDALALVAGYVDNEIAEIKAKTENLPASPAATSDIPSAATVATAVRDALATELARLDADVSSRLAASAYAAAPTADANASALLDLADGVEAGLTLREAQRLQAAAAAGKVSGANTSTVTIRNVGDTADRIVATVDEHGNRSAVTVDVEDVA